MAKFRIPGPLGRIGPTQKTLGNESIDRFLRLDGTPKRPAAGRSGAFESCNQDAGESTETVAGEYVTVFVWVSLIKAMSPGHAALAIRPNATKPEDGYVSFAPEQAGSIAGPGFYYPKEHDIDNYGDIQSDSTQGRGLWVANIFGLDTAPMKLQLENDLKNPPRYSLSNQCATTVHRYLQLGGGDEVASWWSRNVIGFWSPDDVEDYAKSIVENTASLGSTARKHSGEGTVF